MRVVRPLVLLAALVLAGCQIGIADEKAASGSDTGDGIDVPRECNIASDCVLASVKCCDCPSFATPRSDPMQQACDGVVCPAMACPDNVAPACDDGICTLACKPLACDTTCADGYAIDASGCLSCACASPAKSECTTDAECARVPADCCGCEGGGADTAIPASEVARYQQMLGCPPSASCPGVDTCVPGVAPACVQGACALVAAVPPNACGRSDLPACAHCTVNVDDAASAHGLGVCEP